MPKLKLTVLHARDLDAKDVGGTSDPFVKIKVGTVQVKTEIVMKNLNPDWNAVFNLELPEKLNIESESIFFDVYDYDRFSKNDLIGKTSVLLSCLEKGVAQQMTLNLHNAHKGSLTIELLAVDFGQVYEKTQTTQLPPSIHNRSNYFNQLINSEEPPQYHSPTPPPQYDSNDKFNSTSSVPPQYPNQPPQYERFNSFNSTSAIPPQYPNQPPQYSDQCYPTMVNQNYQGYPPVGYPQQPPKYPQQNNQ